MLGRLHLFLDLPLNHQQKTCLFLSLAVNSPFNLYLLWPSIKPKTNLFQMWVSTYAVWCFHMANFTLHYHIAHPVRGSKSYSPRNVGIQRLQTLSILKSWQTWFNIWQVQALSTLILRDWPIISFLDVTSPLKISNPSTKLQKFSMVCAKSFKILILICFLRRTSSRL